MVKYMKPTITKIPSWHTIHCSVKLISYFQGEHEDRETQDKYIKSFTRFQRG